MQFVFLIIGLLLIALVLFTIGSFAARVFSGLKQDRRRREEREQKGPGDTSE